MCADLLDRLGSFTTYVYKSLAPAAVFLAALLPRALSLGTFLTQDEGLWIGRSSQFYSALSHLDWAGTFCSTHPGVTTMWLSGFMLGVYGFCASCGIIDHDFNGYLYAGSLAVALAVSICILLAYFLMRRLFGEKAAILGALFIALDPFLIAHSRVIHLDALLTMFMTLSLLALLAYLNGAGKKRLLVASGVFSGLAMLTKLPGAFMIPFSALMTAGWQLLGERPFSLRWVFSGQAILRIAGIMLALILVSILVFALLWPAMWVEPAGTVARLSDSLSGAVSGQEGSYGSSPAGNLVFYAWAVLLKVRPAMLLLSLACLAWAGLALARGRLTPAQKNVLLLALFAAVFILQMAAGDKKSGRYALPIFPAIDIMASVGLLATLDMVSGLIRGRPVLAGASRFINPLLVFTIITVQVVALLLIHPYYLAYYNPMVIGGPASSPEVLVIGWGEGIDLAAKYLNEKPFADSLVVAAGYPGLEPFFKGETVDMDEWGRSDYIVFYYRDLRLNGHSDLWYEYRDLSPEKVVTINGVDYCWIYKTKPRVP